MLLLLHMCFCFVMREASCCLFLKNNQAYVGEALYSTSRYLDELLNIDNPFFEQRVSHISH